MATVYYDNDADLGVLEGKKIAIGWRKRATPTR